MQFLFQCPFVFFGKSLLGVLLVSLFIMYEVGSCICPGAPNTAIVPLDTNSAIDTTVQKIAQVTGHKVSTETVEKIKTKYEITTVREIADDDTTLTTKSWNNYPTTALGIQILSEDRVPGNPPYTYNQKMRLLSHELLHVIAFHETGNKDVHHRNKKLFGTTGSVESELIATYTDKPYVPTASEKTVEEVTSSEGWKNFRQAILLRNWIAAVEGSK